jgi:hypothetical protein
MPVKKTTTVTMAATVTVRAILARKTMRTAIAVAVAAASISTRQSSGQSVTTKVADAAAAEAVEAVEAVTAIAPLPRAVPRSLRRAVDRCGPVRAECACSEGRAGVCVCQMRSTIGETRLVVENIAVNF